jgi:hypothetical protein
LKVEAEGVVEACEWSSGVWSFDLLFVGIRGLGREGEGIPVPALGKRVQEGEDREGGEREGGGIIETERERALTVSGGEK